MSALTWLRGKNPSLRAFLLDLLIGKRGVMFNMRMEGYGNVTTMHKGQGIIMSGCHIDGRAIANPDLSGAPIKRYSVNTAYDAAKAYVKLIDEIRSKGQPPHADYWCQSLYESEKAVVQSFCVINEARGWVKEVRP